MKAITICQPWAWAIIHAPEPHRKFVENRTWPCPYRGPLLIHAGKSREWLEDPRWWKEQYGCDYPVASALVFGAIIGIVEMVDCVGPDHPKVKGNPYTQGPWCHVYANARPLPRMIPYRGALGLFDVPDSVLTAPVIEVPPATVVRAKPEDAGLFAASLTPAAPHGRGGGRDEGQAPEFWTAHRRPLATR